MDSIEDFPKKILLEAKQHSVFMISVDDNGKMQLACAIPEDATDQELRIFSFLKSIFFPNIDPTGVRIFEVNDDPQSKLTSLKPANKLKI